MALLSASLPPLLASVKKLKLFIADTLALSDLYYLDSRDFSFDAQEFASTPGDVVTVRNECIKFVREFSKIIKENEYQDGFLLLRQLLHSLDLLKSPLESIQASWKYTFQTLQTLYFTLLLVLNVISHVAIFITHSTTTLHLDGEELMGGSSSSLNELLSESKKETSPQLLDAVKSLRVNKAGETLLHYAARTEQPLESAFGSLFHLVQSGSSKLIGLNTQTLNPLDKFPGGSTVLHILSGRFREEDPMNPSVAKDLITLRSYGASPRILNSQGKSALSLLSEPSLRGGSFVGDPSVLQETLVALEGGATELQRGKAAYIRQKYFLRQKRRSNVARVWLNAIVHDAVTTPFPQMLYMDDEWIAAFGPQVVSYEGEAGNLYTSVEELKGDFLNMGGTPYILLDDLLNEDSYSISKGGIFASRVDKGWQGPIEETEVFYQAASEAGFETFPPRAAPKGAGGGGGAEETAGRESAQFRDQMMKNLAESRAARLQKESEDIAVAIAEKMEQDRKADVAKKAGVDPDKLERVGSGYRPMKFINIKVGGLTYRYDNDSYYQFSMKDTWERVTEKRFLDALEKNSFF
jgi:hypothetical protein